MNKLSSEKEQELTAIIKQDAWSRFYVLIAIFIALTVFLFKIKLSYLLTLYALVGIGLVPSFVELWSAKTKKLIQYVIWPSLTSDILMISIASLYTTNYIGVFAAYTISITSSSITGLKEGLYQAFLVAILYPIFMAFKYHVISSGTFNQEFFVNLYQVAPGIFLGIILAIMTGYLADSLKKTRKKAENLTQKIKKLYKESEVSSEVIFEHMEDGFLVIGQDGVIEKANEASFRLLGNANLVGHHIDKLSHSTSLLFSEIFTKAKKGPLTREISISKPERKILETTATPLRLEKGKNRVVIVLKDISPSWGEVFDSKDKHQIQGAIVRIFDKEFNKLLATKVTDGEGRFEFLVQPGQYYLRAIKEGYLFPSRTIGYKGEIISITEKNKSLVNVKIPMDRSG